MVLSNKNIIEIKNVSKKFGDRIAVNNISFNIPENKIFGLLGTNGAGKSTIINILTGLLLQDSGAIKIFNKDTIENIEDIRKNISLVPQTISLYDNLTLFENLEFFGGLYYDDDEQLYYEIEKIINVFDLSKKRDFLVSELSGGFQRRCSIGCAVLSKPKILFLDEPLVGIDVATNNMIIDYIKSLKDTTVIFTSHSMKEAESICDSIVYLDSGVKVLDGDLKYLVNKYSKEIGETIIIEFNSKIHTDILEKYFLKSGFKIKNIVSYDHKISFQTYDLGNTVISVLDSLKKIKKNVLNIDIKKPDLRMIIEYAVEKKLKSKKSVK